VRLNSTRKMKDLNKNFLNKIIRLIYHTIIPGLILQGCSVISTRTITDDVPVQLSRPLNSPSLSETLQFLSLDARIEIDTPDGDLLLFADISYNNIDTLMIQFKDPLKRKLAKLDVFNDEFNFWLQRQGKYYSGVDWLELPKEYGFPLIPIQDISRILIGLVPIKSQSTSVNSSVSYQSAFDDYKRLIKMDITYKKSKESIVISYGRFKQLEDHYWMPTYMKLDRDQNITIEIHYSQFHLELRKLT